ncbi:S-adenosyl-L-methionine-dependent methyltransferase [Hyaloscypha variabilis F]|uniref:S-adenosyl-L-methionine-dependent methyltransferase n=1 Tax=Hyaloscypha variabilis (strain UAMH 11265 / GT02V1 / F) TaxID=1149755 RepID=A0A2J6QXD8_HYAVF|nr:S-adenosyl-L-methionine-dependent methyltransferase [Hyaloscypha variabilis F]
MLQSLFADPKVRLIEIGASFLEARALHIVAEKRIPDILVEGGESGVRIEDLAENAGLKALKLGRLMRTLCSIHVFDEVAPDVYTNNQTSAALVNNEPLRAYILLFALDVFSAADHLPKTLSHPEKGKSYSVSETALQDALGITVPRWEWIREKTTVGDINTQKVGYPGYPSRVEGKDEDVVDRPELEIFGLAMAGGGSVFGQSHVYDYPWADLGKATVVDVGGGVGSFCIQLSAIYPDLSFVIQDKDEFLRQGKEEVWPKLAPEALSSGRVSFSTHDFFKPNIVKGAEVYWLRYIMHDWSDTYCIAILSALAPALTSNSRILLCEQIMNTTLGFDQITKAPEPLPANYGAVKRYSHQRDLCLMSTLNGIERTPAQFRNIIEKAGLKIERFWDCRSQVGLIEVRLP